MVQKDQLMSADCTAPIAAGVRAIFQVSTTAQHSFKAGGTTSITERFL